MRIAVMGTGGVGGYFGGRLAAAGQDVAFIARGAHLEALRQRGLAIRSALGDASIAPVRASDDPAAIGPVDLVLFTVKLYDTEAAAGAIRPLIGPDTGVVTFQNGITGPEVLAREAGSRARDRRRRQDRRGDRRARRDPAYRHDGRAGRSGSWTAAPRPGLRRWRRRLARPASSTR